jgi:carbonic anhydrase/acetyltransferase-like protein (isoleucine patch superfamily)
MAIYQLGAHAPQLHPTAYIADNAQVIGRVHMAEDSSVWFGVIVRGDTDDIRIGRGSNVQDNTVLHTDEGIPLLIGEHVTIGHQCMLHGCTIGDHSLIGIGAIVLNGAKIGRHSIVGAGSLVTEGKEFPDYSMVLGSPAKVVKTLTPEQAERIAHGATHYVDNAHRYQRELKEIAR